MAGVFLMIGFTVLFSPLLVYVIVRAGSVLTAAVALGVINASPGLHLFVRGGSDVSVGLTGAAGLCVVSLANVGLGLYERRSTGTFYGDEQ